MSDKCLLLYVFSNSWWWTETPSETCRVPFQNKFDTPLHLFGFTIEILLWSTALWRSNTFVPGAQVGLQVFLQATFVYDIEIFAAMTCWHFCPRLKYFLAVATNTCTSYSTDIQSAMQHAISSSRRDSFAVARCTLIKQWHRGHFQENTALY